MRTRGPRPARWTFLVQLVACLLLALIVADVASDADCDPLRSGADPAGVSLVAGTAGAASDPCADVCRADCYCCARSVGALSVAVPLVPAPPSPLTAASPGNPPDGVRTSVDRPPRA